MSAVAPPETTTNAPGAALVTGAATRIGRAIALDLGRRGWAVAVHHHSSGEAAEEVARSIVAGGARALALAADLGSETETRALVPRAVAALGPLGLLVNNAAAFEDDTLATATRETWDRHLSVNLRAPFTLIQDFAAALGAAALGEGAEGNVINLLDQRVWNLTPSFTTYTLSKSGLWTLTRTLALALAPAIRVNAIGPGPTLPSERQSLDQFEQQRAATPLGRGTTPEEICEAVAFILGARAMTGQMIALDGGQHLDWAPAKGYHSRPE